MSANSFKSEGDIPDRSDPLEEAPSVAGLSPTDERQDQSGRPLFIVIDGVDGCGKSTQARLLIEGLTAKTRTGQNRDRGLGPVHLREPGSTELGERVRELLLDRGLHLEAEVETLLFAAARRQMLDQLVAPALRKGRYVVCERFHPSTFAYQAVAGNLEPDAVLGLLHSWANQPAPDLILLLDVPVEDASERRGEATDRIEDKGNAFQLRVDEWYRIYAAQHPKVVVIDGARTPALVAADITSAIESARSEDSTCS